MRRLQDNQGQKLYAELEELLEAIQMPAEMSRCVQSCFFHTEEAGYFGAEILTDHLTRAAGARINGVWKKFPEQIYLDTMGCFSRFVKEYHRSYGTWGFDRDFWTTRQISARLFRIGELEYELCEEKELNEDNKLCEAKQLNLHIPSDASLYPDLLNHSINDARDFLRIWFPGWADLPIHLDSWLLSPALNELLSPGSHIREFQKAFDLSEIEWDCDDYLEWVFQIAGGQLETVRLEDLPENTSLQRNMKRYVLSGGKIGIGKGVLVRKF